MALSVNNEPDKSRTRFEGMFYGKQRIFMGLLINYGSDKVKYRSDKVKYRSDKVKYPIGVDDYRS
jgi:hypothetical protein